jgi:hypothetical protein
VVRVCCSYGRGLGGICREHIVGAWVMDRPLCATCGRPVEFFFVYDDIATLSRVFNCRCHGKEAAISVPYDQLESAKWDVVFDAENGRDN